MYVPTTSLVLPITYREYFKGREEVKIYINNKVFMGLQVIMMSIRNWKQ